jgi:hypothetical protein
MAGSKHDAECLRRKEDPRMLYVCTCDLTDAQVLSVPERSQVCSKCGETKPIGEFYKNKASKSGYRTECKACHLLACRARDAADPAKRRAEDKAWRQRNPERVREHNRRYAERHAEELRSRIKAWREEFPEKMRAHNLVAGAIRSGRMAKPDACETCGRQSSLHAHHKDYAKPLDVVWLCSPCHRTLHVSGRRSLLMSDDADELREALREALETNERLREALREIKRVAVIEAPPVSDEVPAKVWKLAFEALGGSQAKGSE